MAQLTLHEAIVLALFAAEAKGDHDGFQSPAEVTRDRKAKQGLEWEDGSGQGATVAALKHMTERGVVQMRHCPDHEYRREYRLTKKEN